MPNVIANCGPVPSERQLAWHALETYAFVHFTLNTFTDKEWGYGDESPRLFNPTQFDADQIAEAADLGGLRGIVLTAKHHDGFCLWPSRHTEHSVRDAPWREGRGDMVRELREACDRRGLRFGVYLSPWDRNHAEYGRAAYIDYYRAQMHELMGEYGPLFEVWFDGANGGDGYYGGAREPRRIDKRTYYDWPNTWAIVREMQPDACMFSDVGPDIRWVGNERGIAGDPCWPTMDTEGLAIGDADQEILNRGMAEAAQWLPAEADVSIRPGWFYHAAEDDQVHSGENLVDLYFQSVGRGAALHLNLPPDTRGLIHEQDVIALRDYRRRRGALFAEDLAPRAALASPQARPDGAMAPRAAADGDVATFWAAPDAAREAEMIVELETPARIGVVSLREPIRYGRRIDRWAVDLRGADGAWREVAAGESIGARRLVRLPDGPEAPALRVRLAGRACPALSECAIYRFAE